MIVEKSYEVPRRRYFVPVVAMFFLTLILTSYYVIAQLDSFAEDYYQTTFPKMLDQYKANNKDDVDFSSVITNAAIHTIKGYFGGFKNSDADSININIKFKHMEKLKGKRREVLNETIFLFARKDDFVPAVIEYKNKKVRVKLRLKGDGNDHLKDPKKWSFRVKTRKGAEFMGMRKFSIQHPKTRGYTYEAIFHKTMKDLGVAALRYDYIDVSINGEPIGVMALEEHFSKELLESQERKDNLIFKASEDKYWEYQLSRIQNNRKRTLEGRKPWSPKKFDNAYRTYTNALNVPFESYGQSKINKSEALRVQKQFGVGLLRAMVHGELKPSDVFDVDNVGAFAAGLWLWESHHPSNFVNVRYYLNPYTLKFEIIAFDANAQERWTFHAIYRQKHGRQLMQLIMSDEKMLAAFQRKAKKLYEKVNAGYIDELKQEADGYRSKLATEFPLLPRIDFTGMEERIYKSYSRIKQGDYFNKVGKPIKAIDFPGDFTLPGVLYAYVTHTESGWQLELQNILMNKVSVTDIEIYVNAKKKNLADLMDIQLPVTLAATEYNKPATRLVIPMEGLAAEDVITVSGLAKPSTQETVYSFDSIPYAPVLSEHPLQPMTIEEIINANPFISVDTKTQTFAIAKGDWHVQEMWIFPHGYSLHVARGAVISFDKGAGFVINGDGQFIGTSDQPIILKSATDGKDSAWAGMAFVEGEKSHWDHVEVHNTDFMRFGLWGLTGAITFYKTDIDLKNVSFMTTSAEDALNIIHSKFSLDSVTIDKSRSDGFDADFSLGSITNSHFINIGGDGIDFSGSNIEVSDCEFEDIVDKAISAGEKSTMEVSSVIVRRSGTGLVSKDNSLVRLSDSKFENIQHSILMSYVKKPEYGGSLLFADNIKFEADELALIAQKGSKLVINGVSIKPIDVDVDKLYQGYMKK